MQIPGMKAVRYLAVWLSENGVLSADAQFPVSAH
jgi:hypothetical protein